MEPICFFYSELMCASHILAKLIEARSSHKRISTDPFVYPNTQQSSVPIKMLRYSVQIVWFWQSPPTVGSMQTFQKLHFLFVQFKIKDVRVG